MALLRTAAVLLLNVLVAAIGPAVVMSPFTHYSGMSDPYLVVHREFLLSAIFAFGLGFSIYWTWRSVAAKWVWVAGLCWFAWRAIPLWFDQRAMLFGSPHTLLGQLSGGDCSFGYSRSCSDAIFYSVPLVRTIFFSVGAYCSSPLKRVKFDDLRSVLPGLFKLIGEEPRRKILRVEDFGFGKAAWKGGCGHY